MTQEHEDQARAAERELADLEERSAQVGEHIEEARADWEAKVADPGVPGAGGNPERRAAGGRQPETAYPAKGSEEEAGEPDPLAGHGESDGGDGETPPPDPT